MKGTLTTLVVICAVAWGGSRAWHYYQTIPPLQRAHWAMEAGDYDSAIPFLDQAAVDNPYDMQVMLDLAECHDRQGDKAMAAMFYRRAKPLISAPDAPPTMEYHRDRFAMLETLGY